MFSADLSWTDPAAEKVGQRRQRRATKREGSISSSTSGSKNEAKNQYGKDRTHPTKSSFGSITKTISFSSVKDSMRRPSTATIVSHLKSPSLTILDTAPPYRDYKDPVNQPDYIYSAKLGPRLPSGAVLESPPQQHVLPARSVPVHARSIPLPLRTAPLSELEAASPNISAEAANIQLSSVQHGAWSVKDQKEADNICQSYEQVKDEILALQNPDAILPYCPRAILPDCPEYDEGMPLQAQQDLKRSPSAANRHSLLSPTNETPFTKYVLPVSGLDSKLELPPIFRGSRSPTPASRIEAPRPMPPKQTLERAPSTKVSQWAAPENWDIVKSQVQVRAILDSDSSNDDSYNDRRQSLSVGSHFQRFVRRMESAGPRIIFERLKEKWDLPGDRAMSDELFLEKHLWALTALQLPSMTRFARQHHGPLHQHPLPPLTPNRRRKILELDGSIGEVYQLSAIYPNSRIYHLTKNPRSSTVPLPSQAVQHEIAASSPADSLASMPLSMAAGVLPLPYANASMHHIRSTRLPTLLPGSQLPSLLAECYRVLKPGGLLELRLMDATPERRSMGPLLAAWLEDRLLLSLESEFKCTRPVTLVPRWAREAGFVALPSKQADDSHDNDPAGELRSTNQIMARCLRLPAVAPNPRSGHGDIISQVGHLTSQAFWTDIWGPYVCSEYNEQWWWDNAEIVEECQEYNTTWDVATMFVMKDHGVR